MLKFVKDWKSYSFKAFNQKVIELFQTERGIYNKYSDEYFKIKNYMEFIDTARNAELPSSIIQMAELKIERLVDSFDETLFQD